MDNFRNLSPPYSAIFLQSHLEMHRLKFPTSLRNQSADWLWQSAPSRADAHIGPFRISMYLHCGASRAAPYGHFITLYGETDCHGRKRPRNDVGYFLCCVST